MLNMANLGEIMGLNGLNQNNIDINDLYQEISLPPFDPWCCYIYANMTGVY